MKVPQKDIGLHEKSLCPLRLHKVCTLLLLHYMYKLKGVLHFRMPKS